jgi:sugar lactone lactonase YvrE/predicted small secreted protein
MKRAAVLLVVLAIALTACTTSRQRGELEGAIRQLSHALSQQPDNPPYMYLLASYHDKAGNSNEVAYWLERLETLGWSYGVNPADFPKSRTENFRVAAERLNAREQRVNNAAAAFTIAAQRDLIPEGIAYDPVDDVFYVSSLHRRKVLRVDRTGAATDFVPEAHENIGGTLGLKVDPVRRLLWTASGVLPEMRNYTKAERGRSDVLAFDLRTGRIARRIPIGTAGSDALPNDMALLPDGSVLVTDSGRGLVLRIAEGSSVAEPWLDGFQYPNGIAASDDGRTVYVADFRGVTRVDIADKSKRPLAARALIGGIDGLAFHRGRLVGIQNSIGNPRVIRIDSNDGSVEILESRNPQFDMPTTGVVVGDELYFIANSQLRSFHPNHTIWGEERLKEAVVLRLKL